MDSLKALKQEINVIDHNVRYYDDHIKLYQEIKEKSKNYAHKIPDFDCDAVIIDDTLKRFRAYEQLRDLLNKKFDLEDAQCKL